MKLGPSRRAGIAALFLLALLGCDASSGDPVADAQLALADAAPGGDADTCLGVGTPCMVESECPDALECYSGSVHGVCSTAHQECGGFGAMPCQDGRTCFFQIAGGLGICLTSEELTCVCARSPQSVQGC